MKIAVGCDHGGVDLKMAVVKVLQKWGHEVLDFGTNDHESVDYPVYGRRVAEAVVAGEADRGIVICGTGIGISIAANKVKGARCALCHDEFTARLTRQHNDANIMAMGGRVIGEGLALSMVKVFLETEFEGGRHQRRIDQLEG